MPTRPEPPVAPTEAHVRHRHGHDVEDPYAWMRQVDDPRLTALLEAENAYTDAITSDDAELRTVLFEEIRGRIRETDLSVPWRKGDWWYQARTFEGKAYPVHVRIANDGSGQPPADDTEAITVLDENAVAEGHEYSQVGGAAVSPDGKLLAWSVDHAGDEAYLLRFRDLETGVDHTDEVPGISYALAWSADSAHVFYTTLDQIRRPWKVWRHELGTDPADDALVYTEPDERYFVGVEANRSGDWILVSSQSAVTSEHHLLDAHDPTGALRLVATRRQDVEVHVEAHRDRLFILSNADGAEDFALLEADVPRPGHAVVDAAGPRARGAPRRPRRVHRPPRDPPPA